LPARSGKNLPQRFAITGLIAGFIAVGVAAFESRFLAKISPPEDKRSLRELAAEAGKKVLKERVLWEKSVETTPEPFDRARIAYSLTGLAAMGPGAISWIKKEHFRMAAGAIALG